ncbi:MAG: Calx-beta domain-containing protein [Bacteroidota bacterium]
MKLNIKITYYIIVCFQLILTNLSAQTGPGGVGNSASNRIWLQSDKITGLIDNDPVITWTDNSGNSNDVTQPNASFRPIYKTNILSGKPVIRFDGVNDRLRKTAFATFPTSAITEYFVHKNNGESNDATLSYASAASDNDFLLFSSNSVIIYRGGATSNTATAINDNAWHIVGASWKNAVPNPNTRFYRDGTQTYTTNNFATGTSVTTNGCFAIAAEQDAVDGSYDASQDNNGDFAEIIIFNYALNQAQRIIVENYLAAKYLINISASGNDYFAFETSHGNEVAGIGRINTDLHTDAQSANIFQVNNPGDLGDSEFFLFGHDNASISSWTTNESPDGGTNIERIAREWKFDETGDVGTVDIIIDTTLLPGRLSGSLKFVLLIDADGDFSSGASVYELCSPGGDEFYEVTGLNINDGEYISIGTIVPVFEFTYNESYNFEEDINTIVNIEVRINYIASCGGGVSADYDITPNTATNPSDYIAASGTVTVPAGSSTATIGITVVGDLTPENTENFNVSLLDGIGIPYDDHNFIIYDNDNPPKLQFNVISSSHTEADGTIYIDVIRTGDNSIVSSCDYRLRISGGSGTATQGNDYNFSPGTLTFNIGENTKQIQVDILEDIIFENDETVIIEIYNVSAGTDFEAGFIEHELTITDNDPAPDIQFNLTVSNGDESIGSANIQVDLSTISEANSYIDYAVIGGTATGGGTDYTLAAGTLTIPTGNIIGNITITIIDDAIQELSETILVELSNPVNSTLGANTQHTYAIDDNDQFGYSGPGGVGNSSNNVFWLKADAITGLSDGNDVTLWADQSGNSNDISQSNTSYTPRYYSNILNSKPVVRWEQADTRIRKTNFSNFPSSAITTIYVNRNSDSNDGIVSYATAADNNHFLIFNNASLTMYRVGNIASGIAGNGNTWRIYTSSWLSSNGNFTLYRNGTQNYTTNGLGTGSSISSGGCLAIGSEQDAVDGGYDPAQAHQGDMAEIIMYNSVLNTAQRIIVENYLSSKFGIAIANDRFAYDAAHGNEVTGIGREDVNNFHLDAQGTSIVRINNPSSLDNNDYMLWGNDNASTATANTTDVPVGIDNRLNRVWRINETGETGTVRVYFDLSSYTINDPNDLAILIDNDDGSFVNASIYTTGLTYSPGPQIVYFTGVNFSDGDWFTIASTTADNPLPIELLSYTATCKEQSIELKWTTASEVNNDFYTLERCADGINWQVIAIVNGAGNSSVMLDYLYIDNKHDNGISYYRLKQTDFDGRSEYSQIIKTDCKNKYQNNTMDMIIFPNPSNGKFNLVFTNETNLIQSITVYNTYGKQVFYSDSYQSEIDLSGNPVGIYFVYFNINSNTKLIIKKIVLDR